MAKQETTEEKKVVKLPKETKAILNKLVNGEGVSHKEIKSLSRNMIDAGFIETPIEDNTLDFLDFVTTEDADFVIDILKAYINTYNAIHETNFRSLDEIISYAKEKGHESQDETLEKVIREITINDVSRPKELVHCTDAISSAVFSNKATVPKDRKNFKPCEVNLGKNKTGKKVVALVSVNYNDVLASLGIDADVPVLSEDARLVLDRVISCYLAGNKVITFNMIARTFSGKMDDDHLYISEELFDMIKNNLDKLRGVLAIANESPKIRIKEPLLSFVQLEAEDVRVIMNGKEIDVDKVGVIEVLKEPPLLEWARRNGNEIDSRDISLQDVPGLNNTLENIRLKSYLYSRIIAMNSEYKRTHGKVKQRRIKIDTIFDYLSKGDKNYKERLLKEKYKTLDQIEKILAYWGEEPPRGRSSKKQKSKKETTRKKKQTPKEKLFYDCEFIKKPGAKREIHAIEINFIAPKKLEKRSE